jgi:NNP family nitrate/nitrite transporter-like MFS transporter
MAAKTLKLLSFQGKTKILHMSWMAFFLSFVVWFNHAPLMGMISASLSLTKSQVSTLLVLNVALTIPARIVIGMLTDRYGPRITYSALLAVISLPCFIFAWSNDFTTLAWSRLALGFVGAGFVVGIRMVSEWFPAHELGIAEGILVAGVISVLPLRP